MKILIGEKWKYFLLIIPAIIIIIDEQQNITGTSIVEFMSNN